MKRSICGMRRSIFICLAPAAAFSLSSLGLPRIFFKKAIGPLAGLAMSSLPKRVSLTTSPADMAHTMALQWSRRACRSAKIGRKWSSMNSMVTIMMSPWAMSSRQRVKCSGLVANSEAEWTVKLRWGSKRFKPTRARSTALLRWVSMVTITTRVLMSCCVPCLSGNVMQCAREKSSVEFN